MKGSFKPCLSVLPSAQRSLWPELSKTSAKLMFGSNFQPSDSLKALVYFNDGDLTALSPTEKNLLIQAVRAVRDLPEVKMTSKKLSAC